MIVGLLCGAISVSATIHYVSPVGRDVIPGGTSWSSPWKTIQFAIDHSDPGDEVWVRIACVVIIKNNTYKIFHLQSSVCICTIGSQMKKEPKYNVPGLRAGIQISRLLCKSPKPLGLAELCAATDLSKHMVYRCLQTLLTEGMIIEVGDGPKYEPSLLSFHYNSKPVARMTITRAAQAPLYQLWEELNECCYLGVLNDNRILYLIHHASGRDIRSGGGRMGGRYLLHADGAGKILAANADKALQDRLIDEGFEKLTDKTIADRKSIQAEMELVRKQGYAIDDEAYIKGIICFSAPVHDYSGKVAGAICCSVLTIHYTLEELEAKVGPRVLECAKRISLSMGWKG
jgi:DNA-binding IclR family transcriptional regulator